MHQINIAITFFIVSLQLQPPADAEFDFQLTQLAYLQNCYGNYSYGAERWIAGE